MLETRLLDGIGSITSLTLRSCSLKDEDILPLAHALHFNKCLVSLDLSDNDIEKSGCTALALALGPWPVSDQEKGGNASGSGRPLSGGSGLSPFAKGKHRRVLEDHKRYRQYNQSVTSINLSENAIGKLGAKVCM